VVFKYGKTPKKFFPYFSAVFRKILFTLLVLLLFAGSSYLLYYPFTKWFGQAYSSIHLWEGDRTPIGSYLTHWGFFLFFVYSFILWEVRDWLDNTPVSALKPFYQKRHLITLGLVLLLAAVLVLAVMQVQVIFLIAPAVLMLGALFFRHDYSETTRFVILLTLGALGLSLMVELIAIQGDIGRMNTVFKFYLQAWTFFALSSAYYLFHLLPDIAARWRQNWRNAWQVIFALLSVSVLLFPLTASYDKITDRMNEDVPLTLDGMDYMQYSSYLEGDTLMDLSQDHAAIRWMQDNISGTPVIIEAHLGEYHWGNRFTIYTGLPGVVGWNWHQRQQRAINPSEWVYERVDDVGEFYLTSDVDRCQELLDKYAVEYIVVGQLEQAVYPQDGLDKFTAQNGVLWDEVYASEDTHIYHVRE
jgi:YYY domain-containing protein